VELYFWDLDTGDPVELDVKATGKTETFFEVVGEPTFAARANIYVFAERVQK
jgi:hypothetical protein